MDALGINIPGIVTQLVSFLVLFGLLYKLLYNPILKMLDERSTKIKESLQAAEDAQKEASEAKSDMEKQLQEARIEGQTMISQAREAADRFRDEEIAKAREERARAESDIQRERDAAVDELRKQFADLAITAAEKVTLQSINKSAHTEVIEEVLKEASSAKATGESG